MKSGQQRAATVREMESFANLVEDNCSDPKCGMTILVDKDLKKHGRKSLCNACLMRTKLGRK